MGMDSGDLSDFVENVEWECHGMPATKNIIMYGCCADPYPDITYTVLLQRRSSFYIFNLLLPCFLISFLAPLGFYLPADSGEKVSLGVTVLLALTVFQLMVAESMPPSESVPLIGECPPISYKGSLCVMSLNVRVLLVLPKRTCSHFAIFSATSFCLQIGCPAYLNKSTNVSPRHQLFFIFCCLPKTSMSNRCWLSPQPCLCDISRCLLLR